MSAAGNIDLLVSSNVHRLTQQVRITVHLPATMYECRGMLLPLFNASILAGTLWTTFPV